MFPNVNQDLTGLEPIDWKLAHEKYPAIVNYEGETLKILPRDDVMLSIVTGAPTASNELVDLEEICKELPDSKGATAREIRVLAKQFIVLKNKDARLPKFSKWVTSMFQNKPEINALLAQMGQQTVSSSNIVISCNPVDILRGGIGKHFMTCLGPQGGGGWGYADVLPGVLQECPGVAVAFIDDGTGAYRARCWVHHIEVDGKTAIQMNRPYGNGINPKALAELIASKGYDVYDQSYGGNTRYKFINNFKRKIHWDALESPAQGNLIAAAVPQLKKKRAA